MNSIGYSEIRATDVATALRFYQMVFGWRFTRQEGLPIEYYDIETGGIRSGLLKRPVPAPYSGTGNNAFVCSVQVRDFDKTSEAILTNGG